MILVILQNAWRYRAKPGDTEFIPGVPRERIDRIWREALIKSRSGQRLLQMLPSGIEWTAINASPFVGNKSRSHFPFDAAHVAEELTRFPDNKIALLCGVEAHKAEELCLEAGMTVIKVHHPAYRLLTTKRCGEIRAEIENWLSS